MFRYVANWLSAPVGMFPWFEHNQGFLSVGALSVALAALVWEFRQAKIAEQAVELSKIEAEAKDRKSILSATQKGVEDRIMSRRDEIVSFCFAIEQTIETLLRASRLETRRLKTLGPGVLAGSAPFIAEGFRVQRAVEALLARPPADHDAILAACRALEPFASWKYLEVLAQPVPLIAAIEQHVTIFKDAKNKLAEARSDASNVAQQQLAESWATD